MKKGVWKQFTRHALFATAMLLGSMWLVSCHEDYYFDEKEPSWLGASIYDYLKEKGNFTTYVRIIDDLGYAEVMGMTGSKTIFVADDAAFERFFNSNNAWGVKSYSELTMAQKALMLNYATIENTYLVQMLSNYDNGTLNEGVAIRRATAMSIYDSLAFQKGTDLPNGALWQNYKEKGLYLLDDITKSPLVYFLQTSLDNLGISDEDFAIITGTTRTANDAHILNLRVKERDITCKNGYVNVLEDVMIPPMNMAQYVRKNPSTQLFSSLLERFCAPYYASTQTQKYKETHLSFNDSIFAKVYYSANGGVIRYPDGTKIDESILLPLAPNWNSYYNGSLQADMAAMFVPTDQALTDYFNSGSGKVLKDRYGTWDNVPNNILALLLKRHMRTSFIESIPSRFSKMIDTDNSPLPVKTADVDGTYIGVNGLVYLTNKVYPPDDYNTIYAPVLFNDKAKVFNWAILKNDYKLYLNSLVSTYAFFVPTDDYLKDYIDPFTIGKDMPGALKFWYNNKTSQVNATVYKYDLATRLLGDSVAVVNDTTFLKSRLLDLLDSHIVVGGVENGQTYYLTKGNNVIKVTGSGAAMSVEGGGDIAAGTKSNVLDTYNQANGKVYMIDHAVQTPLSSVYKVLSETPEFKEFYTLLSGFPNSNIFVKSTGHYGIDYNVSFFNTYNYTVYVPVNDSIVKAIKNGIISPWITRDGKKGINSMTGAEKEAAILKLERFLRYHFQDKSVFVGNGSVSAICQSATIKNNDGVTQFGTFKNKFYKLGVSSNGSELSLKTENYGTANVVTSGGKYNILVRDYTFIDDPKLFKEIDGSGTAAKNYPSSTILTSATAVIHQIDNVLRFE